MDPYSTCTYSLRNLSPWSLQRYSPFRNSYRPAVGWGFGLGLAVEKAQDELVSSEGLEYPSPPYQNSG